MAMAWHLLFPPSVSLYIIVRIVKAFGYYSKLSIIVGID